MAKYKYIVKVSAIATEACPGFAGETRTFYYGKSSRSTYELYPYFIEHYGYDRECDAKRHWSYTSIEDTPYWKYKPEIIKLTL